MARKRLNKNVVVGLTLFAFVAAIVLSVVMLRQLRQRDPKYFLERAVHYEEGGDWKQAALFYSKAWERSQDPVHLVFQGQMWLNDGDVPRAIACWRRALIENPDQLEAHRANLDVLQEFAQFGGSVQTWLAVKEAAEKMLDSLDQKEEGGGKEGEEEKRKEGKNGKEANRAYALHALGLSLVHLRGLDESNVAKGLAHLEEAYQLAGQEVDYALDLARQYVAAERDEDAEELFQQLLERSDLVPGNAARVRGTYAAFLASPLRDNATQGEIEFKKAVDLAVDDPEALVDVKLAYAAYLTRQWVIQSREDADDDALSSLLERAEAELKEAIAADDRYGPYIQLGTLYLAVGKYEKTVGLCENRLKEEFIRRGISAAREKVDRFNLMILAAQASIAQAVSLDKEVQIAVHHQWLSRAEQFVTDALAEFPNHPKGRSLTGQIKLVQGRDREALEDLRAAEEGYHSTGTVDWQNKMVLAGLHLRLGEAGAAKEVLENAFYIARRERSGDPDFWVLYGKALFANDQMDTAMTMVDHVLRIQPGHEQALQLKAAIYERRGRTQEAGMLIAEATGSQAVQLMLQFREHLDQGDVEGGLAILREALKENAANAQVINLAVRDLVQRNHKSQARQMVQSALATAPDDRVLKRLELLLRDDLSEAQRDEAMLKFIDTEEDAYQRALEYFDFYTQRNEHEQALEWIDKAQEHLIAKDTTLTQRATSTQHRELLTAKLRLAFTLEDETAMIEARDAASTYNVDGAKGKIILGLFHALRSENTMAIRALREALETQPTDASALAYLGQCLLNEGDPDEADNYFRRAVRVSPREALAHRGLAAIAQRQGDKEAYEHELDICKKLLPGDPWVQAEILAQREQADPEKAIARRETDLKDNPEDVQNIQRLALLCEMVHQLSKADQYYQRLLTLRPDDRAVALLVHQYYRRTDRSDEAVEVLRRFADTRKIQEEKARALVLVAGSYLGEKDFDRTESILLEALKIAQPVEVLQSLAEFYFRDRNDPVRALTWYEQAVPKAEAVESPGLPNLLAQRIACRLHHKMDDFEGARKGVEELRRKFPDSLKGLYWQSEIEVRSGNTEQAVTTLTEYLRRSPDDAFPLYQRAQYYLALGLAAPAIADLEQIKRIDPLALELRPRILLARLHERVGRIEAAIRELEGLVEESPDSAGAAEELVRAYLRQSKFQEAERVIVGQINRHKAESEARWYFLRGQVADHSKDLDRAVRDYQRAFELDPTKPEFAWMVLDTNLRAQRSNEGIFFFEKLPPEISESAVVKSKYAVLLHRAERDAAKIAKAFRQAMTAAHNQSISMVRRVTEDLSAAMSVEEGISLFQSTPVEPELQLADRRILVRLYRLAGRLDDAQAVLQQAIASAQNDLDRARLFYEAGEIAQVRGNAESARDAYAESLKYDPQNWITHNNLAYLLADDLELPEEALPHAQQAVRIIETPDTLDTLGWVLAGLGRFSEAVAQLSRALRLDPDNPTISYHLGEAYRRNGQMIEAKDVLQRGLEAAKTAEEEESVTLIEASLERVSSGDSSD